MKNDSNTPIVAKVDIRNTKYTKPESLGIDYTNQIDVWSKMEFRYREQIKKLSKNKTLDGHEVLRDLNSLVYAIREKIE